MDKKEGGGSHNWGTFEDEMKAEEDKANTSDGMNDSAVEADPKEATDAAPAAPAGPTAEDEEALARKVNFLTMSTKFDTKTFQSEAITPLITKMSLIFFNIFGLKSRKQITVFYIPQRTERKITILNIS